MPVFINNRGSLKVVDQIQFELEKDIQTIVQNNMKTILGVDLIASEFELNGLRVDSLVYNEESKSFSIIEHKKDRNFSVIDQGYAYLSKRRNISMKENSVLAPHKAS